MKNSCYYSLVAVVALLVFGNGCAATPVGDPRVIVDSSVRGIVSVLHIGYDETKQGAKTVDVTIQNKKNTARMITVSTQWFANGQAFHSMLTEPRRVSLLPHEITTIHEVAPNAKQDSFRITFSKP